MACAPAQTAPQTTTPTTQPTLPPNSPTGRGEALFNGKARCSACHSLSPGKLIVGPSLAGIGEWGAHRRAGMDAAAYIEDSIVNPDAYKSPGFENMQMDGSIVKTLTSDELSDIVAFLLTQK